MTIMFSRESKFELPDGRTIELAAFECPTVVLAQVLEPFGVTHEVSPKSYCLSNRCERPESIFAGMWSARLLQLLGTGKTTRIAVKCLRHASGQSAARCCLRYGCSAAAG